MSFYKRNLPHYQPIGYAYFITTRLTGTIPYNIYQKYRAEYDAKLLKLSTLKNKSEKQK